MERTRGRAPQRHERLEHLRQSQSRAAVHRHREVEFGKAARSLRLRTMDDAALTITALAGKQQELDAEAAVLQQSAQGMTTNLQASQATLDEAAADGGTIASLSGAAAMLSSL